MEEEVREMKEEVWNEEVRDEEVRGMKGWRRR